MGEVVRLEVDASRHVAVIRIERPPVNAISDEVWLGIERAAQEADAHDDVRAVVVHGGRDVFAAGADITALPDLDDQELEVTADLLQRSMETLARLPMVTIAAINGYALGGGCEVALACDFRFAASDATLGQPEILLGLIPGAGGTQRLPRLIGLSRAKDLIYTGRMVDADEAERIGLVDRVVAPDDVLDDALEAAARYAAGPASLRLAKRAIDEGTELPIDPALRLERSTFVEAFGTHDARVGIASFLEHGPGRAHFTGR